MDRQMDFEHGLERESQISAEPHFVQVSPEDSLTLAEDFANVTFD